MTRITRSYVAPNPKEFEYWVDLAADPKGNVIKYYAERILQEYLKSANQWEEEYSLEPTDPVVGEIDNNEVYRFEVRYKENVEEVGSRLINNYAITMDGKTIFLYDPANDQWIIQK